MALADSPLDIVVVGREIEKILVEELDMRFRLHDEIGFKSGTLGKERYVAVKNIYLLALLGHERHATPLMVNPQMAAQPIMVAITVIIASRVFCSRDFISMIILLVG